MRMELLTTNTLLKFLSLVLAGILWFFVVSNKRSETVIDVPVRFINISPSLEIVDTHKTISIRLEAQERLLRELRQDDISIVINLNGYKEGKVSYHLSNENIRVPSSFVIKNIYPSKIDFILKKMQAKENTS